MSIRKNNRDEQVQAIEMPSVRATIVDGRPPGSGQPVGLIPRGIEVLVKKASVDAAFKEVLLAQRSKAANEIGLVLDATETVMLDLVPAAQLAAIIASTRVDEARRPAFLGKAAAVMLVALGATGLTSNAQVVDVAGLLAVPPATTTSAPASQPDQPVLVPMPVNPQTPMAGVVPMPVPRPASKPATTTSQPTTNNGIEVPVEVRPTKGERAVPPVAPVAPPASTQPFTYPAVSADDLNKLIPLLDHDDFKVRQDAQNKLQDLGVGAVPLLREKLAKEKLSLEAQTRIQAVLSKLEATTQPAAPNESGPKVVFGMIIRR